MQQAQMRSGSDELLAVRAQAGDQQAMAEIMRRFERLATGIAARYYMQGGDRDDLRQEARLGVFKAIRDFNASGVHPFGAFARLCVERQVITALKNAGRVKHHALTRSTRTARSEEGSVVDAVDMVEARNADAHELLVDRERALLVMRVVREALSPLERACVVGFANGESYVDTTHRLGVSLYSKTVDNALQRARLKIARALEEDTIPLGAAA